MTERRYPRWAPANCRRFLRSFEEHLPESNSDTSGPQTAPFARCPKEPPRETYANCQVETVLSRICVTYHGQTSPHQSHDLHA
eukprot:9389688-Pyramimonas_sp.AAC.1